MIRPDHLRKMVIGYAYPGREWPDRERPPKAEYMTKDPAEEDGQQSQRLLITWMIEDDPSCIRLYVGLYISLEDFTEELYRKVAEKMFAEHAAREISSSRQGSSACLRMRKKRGRQRSCSIHASRMSTKQERERAFHEHSGVSQKNSYHVLYGAWVQMSTPAGGGRQKSSWKNYKETAYSLE